MVKKYVFGPIASRRLGISLGVDLVTPKICPLNCVYCEARETTLLTMERREYVPVERVLAELDDTLKSYPRLDYVTFSGSGEPTLNSGIGRVVAFLKEHYPQYRICLLTNGLLLGDPELRKEIASVDLVIPSLDGSNAAEYEAANRPIAEMPFDRFVAELTDFVRTAPMRVELEVFIMPGVNDSDESIARFVRLIGEMKPARVQLNTLDRPGAVPGLHPAPPDTVRRFITALEHTVPVEAVGAFRYKSPDPNAPAPLISEAENRILELILRRPATLPDLALALELPENQVQALLDRLFAAGKLGIEKQSRGLFYCPAC